MLKKYLSVFVFLIFIINLYAFTVSAETVLVTEDFSKYTSDISTPWSSLKTGYSARDSFPVRDTQNGKFLKITPLTAWPYKISRNIDKVVTDNLITISFDILIDGTSNGEFMNGYLWLTDSNGTDYGLVNANTKTKDGNFDAYISMSSTNLLESKKTFKDGEWHKVNIFLDFSIKRVTYFLDNQYWCDTKIPDTLTSIKTIDIMSVASGEHTISNPSPVAMGIDNLRISDITYDDVLNLIEDREPVPSYLMGNISYLVSSENTGNIFFDKNVKFDIKMKNTYVSGLVKSSVEIYKENGELVKRDVIENNTLIGDVIKNTYSFEVSEYGLYLFRISSESGMFDKTVRFSVCNPPENGIKNSKLGVDTDFDEGYRGMPSVNIPLISKAGFGIAREAFRWKNLDADKKGAKLTQRHSDFVNLANENNINISALASGGNTAYTSESPPKSDSAIADYASYCGQLTTLVKGKAEYIEVWNEYMLNGFNNDNLPPEDYARLLIASYKEIKKSDPNMRVSAFSLPGFSDIVQSGSIGGLSSKEWLRRVLAYLRDNNALECFDVVSVHPYILTCMPDDGSIMKLKYDELIGVLAEYNKEDTPIVATEAGWSTQNAFIDQKSQANALLRQAIINEAYDMYEKMIIYVFQCYGHSNSDRDVNFGIINTFDGECPNTARPAYVALCNYNRIMSGAKFVDTVSEDIDTVYQFENRNGDTTYTMWNKSGRNNIKIADDSVYGVLCDIYGNEKNVYSTDGIYDIEIDENTSYLTIPKNQVEIIDISNKYSENSDYKKLFVGIDKPYTVICKDDENISLRNYDDIFVSLYCQTEVVAGARLDAICNDEKASFVWEFRKNGSEDYEKIVNDENYFIIDNAHTDGYIRVVVIDDDSKKSAEVYVKPINGVFTEWRSNLPMVEKAPDNLLFTCDEKTFSMIDYDGEKKQLFATVTDVVKNYCHEYYKGSAIQKFDKDDENSVLHFVNTNDFKNAVIGDRLKNYLVTTDWVTESGNIDGLMPNQQIDRCDVSLLSVTEYINNIDKIGYNIGDGAIGCFLRTPSYKTANGSVVYIPKKKKIIQTEISNKGESLIYPRAVFNLDIDFLKEIHIDVDTMGEDIKKIILDNFTINEMSGKYSLDELLEIGYKLSDTEVLIAYCNGKLSSYTELNNPDYQWQYSFEPENHFTDVVGCEGAEMIPTTYLRKDAYVRLKVELEDKSYYSNIIKLTDSSDEYTYYFSVSGMTADTPQEYIFMENGDNKSYILLDTKKRGDKNSFFVIRNDYDSRLDFSITAIRNSVSEQDGKYKLMVNDEHLDMFVGSNMKNYLIPYDWDMDDFDYTKKTVESKINMLSADEYITYANKIGYNIGKSWWLRSPCLDGNNNSYCCIIGDSQNPQTMIKSCAVNSSLNFRPVFYLSREYFIEKRLDLSKTGQSVISLLKNNFLRDELKNTYSESELDIIFDEDMNFDSKIVADLKKPSELYLFDNLKNLKPLVDKITVNGLIE